MLHPHCEKSSHRIIELEAEQIIGYIKLNILGERRTDVAKQETGSHNRYTIMQLLYRSACRPLKWSSVELQAWFMFVCHRFFISFIHCIIRSCLLEQYLLGKPITPLLRFRFPQIMMKKRDEERRREGGLSTRQTRKAMRYTCKR